MAGRYARRPAFRGDSARADGEAGAVQPITVVTNWQAALKK